MDHLTFCTRPQEQKKKNKKINKKQKNKQKTKNKKKLNFVEIDWHGYFDGSQVYFGISSLIEASSGDGLKAGEEQKEVNLLLINDKI